MVLTEAAEEKVLMPKMVVAGLLQVLEHVGGAGAYNDKVYCRSILKLRVFLDQS